MDIFNIIIYICFLVIILLCYFDRSEHFINKYTDFFDDIQIYTINLKKRPDKLSNIIRELDRNHLSGYVFNAIDGSQLNINGLKNENIVDQSTQLSSGQLGCYLSHKDIWDHFLHSNKKYALIFEDDAILSNNFKSKLNSIFEELLLINYNWDVIYLNDLCYKFFGNQCTINHKVTQNTYRPSILGYGTLSYIINKKAATYFLDNSQTLKMPVDDFILSIQIDQKSPLSILKLYKPLCMIRDEDDSDIRVV
jgi:GR25 family glycosyltransferase involved in LPS biosynthesis